ncbi:uncharacterized protein [Dermacentor albipictus]|uniref:uncharacterized protein n=1 Tax=Dermacentor albipictus TaxID=60249 RepID=UPI0038FC4A67
MLRLPEDRGAGGRREEVSPWLATSSERISSRYPCICRKTGDGKLGGLEGRMIDVLGRTGPASAPVEFFGDDSKDTSGEEEPPDVPMPPAPPAAAHLSNGTEPGTSGTARLSARQQPRRPPRQQPLEDAACREAAEYARQGQLAESANAAAANFHQLLLQQDRQEPHASMAPTTRTAMKPITLSERRHLAYQAAVLRFRKRTGPGSGSALPARRKLPAARELRKRIAAAAGHGSRASPAGLPELKSGCSASAGRGSKASPADHIADGQLRWATFSKILFLCLVVILTGMCVMIITNLAASPTEEPYRCS